MNITNAHHQPEEPSLFFTLPAELRNDIYKYVLTYDGGLACVGSINATTTPRLVTSKEQGRVEDDGKDYGPSGGRPHLEANQLKYVSRKTRRETLRLELEYNQLTFHYQYIRRRGQEPMCHAHEQLAFFYSHCSSATRSHMKKIILHESLNGYLAKSWVGQRSMWATLTGGGRAASLYSICEQNPRLRVIVRFDELVPGSGWQWLSLTASFRRAMRGSSDIFINAVEESDVAFRSYAMLLERMRSPVLDNLRMSFTPTFDEKWFQEKEYMICDDATMAMRLDEGFRAGTYSRDDRTAVMVDRERRIRDARRLFDEGV
jgi:hypothetical protein